MREVPGLVSLVIGLAVLALVFGLLERVAWSIPRKPLFRRERTVDFAWWFFTPWISRTASTIAVFLAVAFLAVVLKGQPSHAWFERQKPIVQVLELLIAADLLGYASHRLFHGRRLWRFHAIHHSAEDLDWLSATRVHPVNEVGNRLMQVVPLYLLGFRGEALAAVVPILTFYALFIHANIRWDFGPLRYVIATPVFHRWHHTSQEEGLDKNFAGLFPWIDIVLGTFYMPKGRQPEKFGVHEAVPRGLLGQLAYPFKRARLTANG
jgi:sterol desaturase/sphingolipid hydroxylase (fatty acid hydroxylase superfamily)